MKVIIEQTAGVDYPVTFRGNPQYRREQEVQIRRRLQLRPLDKVEIREVGKQ